MSKMIQIRNVSDDVHKVLKARAAQDGMSLSDYIKRYLEQTAKQPTISEWFATVRKSKPASPPVDSAKLIRKIRDAADRR